MNYKICILLISLLFSTINPSHVSTVNLSYVDMYNVGSTKNIAIAAIATLLGWLVYHNKKYISNLIQYTWRDPNTKNKQGNTPLQQACQDNDIETVQFLVSHPKIDPNTLTQILARAWSNHYTGTDLLKILLSNKRIILTLKDLERTYAHKNCELVKIVLKNINPQIISNNTYTILSSALFYLQNNNNDIIEALVRDPHIKPTEKDLYLAYYYRKLNMLEILIAHPNIDPSTAKINGPRGNELVISFACNEGYLDIVKILLNRNVIPKLTNLASACDNNHIEIVKLLINHPDLNPKNLLRDTDILRNAYTNKQIEFINFLLSHPRVRPTFKALDTVLDHGSHEQLKILLNKTWKKILRLEIKLQDRLLSIYETKRYSSEWLTTFLNSELYRALNIEELLPLSKRLNAAVKYDNCTAITVLLNTARKHMDDPAIFDCFEETCTAQNFTAINCFFATKSLTTRDRIRGTLLYIAHEHGIPMYCTNESNLKKNNFTTKKEYFQEELFFLPQISRTEYKNCETFIDLCIKNGADLSLRDHCGRRAVDIAEQKREFNPKVEPVYQALLTKTNKAPTLSLTATAQ